MVGLTISWWVRAVNGTTYRRLDRDWRMGVGIWDAIIAGKHTNLIAAACIFTTLTAVDGPLLQRAITVAPKVLHTMVDLDVRLAPEVPSEFTGVTYIQKAVPGDDTYYEPDMSISFAPVFFDLAAGNPMQGAISGCPGACTTAVRAPALVQQSCNSTQRHMDYWAPHPKDGMSPLFGDDPMRYVFYADMASVLGETEQMLLRVGMADASVENNRTSTYTVTDCYYASAIAEYPVQVSSTGTISFVGSVSNPRIVQPANNTAINQTAPAFIPKNNFLPAKTTLSGIAAAGVLQYPVNYGLTPSDHNINNTGPSLTGERGTFTVQQILNYDEWLGGALCIPHWRDPTDQIIAGLNEMMFRTGIQAAKVVEPAELQSLIDSDLKVTYSVQGLSLIHI